MKGIIFEVKENGVHIMDKEGFFSFVPGFTNSKIGEEIVFEAEAQTKARNMAQKRPVSYLRRLAIAASVSLIAGLGLFGASWNITQSYIYVDINPSVEVAFNCWNMSIRSSDIGNDGIVLIKDEKVKGSYAGAAMSVLNAAAKNGYELTGANENPDVLITFVSDNMKKANNAIAKLSVCFAGNGVMGVEFRQAGMADRCAALRLGVSPGKLIIAEEMLGLGYSYSLDEILRMPVSEILRNNKD